MNPRPDRFHRGSRAPVGGWARGGPTPCVQRVGIVLLALVLGAGAAGAQELTPRKYAPNPSGGNIVVLGYTRSTGGVLFDPALPFDDVNATINSGSLLYGRTFGPLGRSANAAVVLREHPRWPRPHTP